MATATEYIGTYVQFLCAGGVLVVAGWAVSKVLRHRHLEFNRLWRARLLLVALAAAWAVALVLRTAMVAEWIPSDDTRDLVCGLSFAFTACLELWFAHLVLFLLRHPLAHRSNWRGSPNQYIVGQAALWTSFPVVFLLVLLVLALTSLEPENGDLYLYTAYDPDRERCVLPLGYLSIEALALLVWAPFFVIVCLRLSRQVINRTLQRRVAIIQWASLAFLLAAFGTRFTSSVVKRDQVALAGALLDIYGIVAMVWMSTILEYMVLKPVRDAARDPLPRFTKQTMFDTFSKKRSLGALPVPQFSDDEGGGTGTDSEEEGLPRVALRGGRVVGGPLPTIDEVASVGTVNESDISADWGAGVGSPAKKKDASLAGTRPLDRQQRPASLERQQNRPSAKSDDKATRAQLSKDKQAEAERERKRVQARQQEKQQRDRDREREEKQRLQQQYERQRQLHQRHERDERDERRASEGTRMGRTPSTAITSRQLERARSNPDLVAPRSSSSSSASQYHRRSSQAVAVELQRISPRSTVTGDSLSPRAAAAAVAAASGSGDPDGYERRRQELRERQQQRLRQQREQEERRRLERMQRQQPRASASAGTGARTSHRPDPGYYRTVQPAGVPMPTSPTSPTSPPSSTASSHRPYRHVQQPPPQQHYHQLQRQPQPQARYPGGPSRALSPTPSPRASYGGTLSLPEPQHPRYR